MTAIEVRINGKKRCVAGIAHEGVIAATLAWSRRADNHPDLQKEDVRFRVGGLDSKRDEHVEWLTHNLGIGDEIVLRIVDAVKVDSPKKEGRTPAAQVRRRQKAHVRRMAKHFGWKIQTK